MKEPTSATRRGFTLIELLIVVGIVTLLMAMVVPAVQRVREAANRLTCANHLRDIGFAVGAYRHSHNDEFPMGGGDSNWKGLPVPRSTSASGPTTRRQQDWGWAYQILPYLDAAELWAMSEQEIAARALPAFFCPSRREPQVIDNAGGSPNPAFGRRGAIDYAGNLGIFTALNTSGQPDEPILNFLSPPGIPPFRSGMILKARSMLTDGTYFYIDAPLRPRDVTDGLTYTMLLGEKRLNQAHLGQPQLGDHMGFVSGYGTTTLRTGALAPARDTNDGAVTLTDQFGSAHRDSMNVLFGDGSVRAVRYDISEDLQVCVVWLPPLRDRGIEPLIGKQYPPNALWTTLFQRLCHRSDGGTINLGNID
jgi:prepilin-type N-terminal cleavage/methylation domain-containing protein/prepilin-type processing-associated H-X9-DG protein